MEMALQIIIHCSDVGQTAEIKQKLTEQVVGFEFSSEFQSNQNNRKAIQH